MILNLINHPIVCNNCKNLSHFTLSTHIYIYKGTYAFNEYKHTLSKTRSGIIIDKEGSSYSIDINGITMKDSVSEQIDRIKANKIEERLELIK